MSECLNLFEQSTAIRLHIMLIDVLVFLRNLGLDTRTPKDQAVGLPVTNPAISSCLFHLPLGFSFYLDLVAELAMNRQLLFKQRNFKVNLRIMAWGQLLESLFLPDTVLLLKLIDWFVKGPFQLEDFGVFEHGFDGFGMQVELQIFHFELGHFEKERVERQMDRQQTGCFAHR